MPGVDWLACPVRLHASHVLYAHLLSMLIRNVALHVLYVHLLYMLTRKVELLHLGIRLCVERSSKCPEFTGSPAPYACTESGHLWRVKWTALSGPLS